MYAAYIALFEPLLGASAPARPLQVENAVKVRKGGPILNKSHVIRNRVGRLADWACVATGGSAGRLLMENVAHKIGKVLRGWLRATKDGRCCGCAAIWVRGKRPPVLLPLPGARWARSAGAASWRSSTPRCWMAPSARRSAW